MEVQRVRMPEGPVSVDDFAETVAPPGERRHPFDIFSLPHDLFRPDTNVLAVELHRSFAGPGGSLVFGCEVTLQIESRVLDPLPLGTLAIAHDGLMLILNWTDALAVLEEATTLQGTNTIWTPLPAATSPHAVTSHGPSRFYRLRR